jgi:hypothetical protein
MLRVNGQRLRVIADAAGERLTLEPVEGEGTLKLEINSLDGDAQIVEAEIMVWGADGSAFSLRDLDHSHPMPVGKYTFGTVRVFIKADESRNLWSFVFSRNSLSDREGWHTIHADQETVADPIGRLRFDVELPETQNVRPGEFVSVNPRLMTADGLVINGSRYGNRLVDRDSNNQATICTMIEKGKVASTCNSGFA